MELKKLAPWNWFRKENTGNGHGVPVRFNRGSEENGSLTRLHDEMDRLFDDLFSGFGWSPFGSGAGAPEGITGSILKPRLNLGATRKAYTVSLEIPGVREKDISLELAQDTLIICGEKRQGKEEKNKNFYRMERSYGAFQRTLSLPEDADRDRIKAGFKNGVLDITIPRMAGSGSRARQIEIKYA
ncbi:MAG: Hsp20/alpha crystallin family protein [Desulfobacter sp.]|nr:MAG: Hsp20/alpha crystallin family protein [Desulfobacter sp.]